MASRRDGKAAVDDAYYALEHKLTVKGRCWPGSRQRQAVGRTTWTSCLSGDLVHGGKSGVPGHDRRLFIAYRRHGREAVVVPTEFGRP